MNESEQEAGGIHLFENSETLDAYLNSEIVADIISNPALGDFSVKQFDRTRELTEVTRGPVGTAVAA